MNKLILGYNWSYLWLSLNTKRRLFLNLQLWYQVRRHEPQAPPTPRSPSFDEPNPRSSVVDTKHILGVRVPENQTIANSINRSYQNSTAERTNIISTYYCSRNIYSGKFCLHKSEQIWIVIKLIQYNYYIPYYNR